MLYLDFAKAFDKVPHRRLIDKLEAHGISGKISGWIEEWLSGRRQRVCINGSCSGWRPVTSGVPRGSVLGPVLFLIFINDLDTSTTRSILKFADDTKVLGKADEGSEIQTIQDDLDKLDSWAGAWQMTFNVEKCKVMHLGGRNTHHPYFLGGVKLGVVDEEKDLGVIITSNLKSGGQCRVAYNKAVKILGMIFRTITFKDRGILLCLYKTLVRSLLEYSSPAWSPH